MKICILSAVNIRHMSLISLYTERLRAAGIPYDLIYMDKYGEEEATDAAHVYRFVNVIDQKLPGPVKALKYMRFVPYAKRILRRNGYDRVIVWNDLAIFMFARFLARRFPGRYCLNVRDNMYYDKKIFRARYRRAFLASAFNTISSDGYRDFLPPEPTYLQVHSLNPVVTEKLTRRDGLRPEGEPIRIGFVGSVRYYEDNKKLLDVFAGDPRFEVHFYGTHADVLRAYADEKHIANARFHDTFPISETASYLERIDVMNNLYDARDLNVRKALSIRLYYCIYGRFPILVAPGTYMETVTRRLGIGFTVRAIDPAMKEELYAWYRGLDFAAVRENCDDYCRVIAEQNAAFDAQVKEFLKEA